jgi:hypothetical protein
VRRRIVRLPIGAAGLSVAAARQRAGVRFLVLEPEAAVQALPYITPALVKKLREIDAALDATRAGRANVAASPARPPLPAGGAAAAAAAAATAAVVAAAQTTMALPSAAVDAPRAASVPADAMLSSGTHEAGAVAAKSALSAGKKARDEWEAAKLRVKKLEQELEEGKKQRKGGKKEPGEWDENLSTLGGASPTGTLRIEQALGIERSIP